MNLFVLKIFALALAIGMCSSSLSSSAFAQQKALQDTRPETVKENPGATSGLTHSNSDSNLSQPTESRHRWNGDHWEHGFFPGIFVPITILLFVMIAFITKHFFREKTEQRRLELLTAMLQKGQAIPETVVSQIMQSSGRDRHRHSLRECQSPARLLRRGFTFTFMGAGFLTAYFYESRGSLPFLILGIVFLGIGLGNLLTMKMKDKDNQTLPPTSID